MKKLFSLLGGLLLLTTGCDKIEKPLKNNPYGPMVGIIDSSQLNKVQKRILIEDYTGAACVNCTKAVTEAEKLSLEYPGRIIVMGIHTGIYATPDNEHPEDFRTPEGDQLRNFFDVLFFPAGMINRYEYPNSNITLVQDWKQKIEDNFDTTLSMEIYIDSVQKLPNDQVEAHLRIKAFENIPPSDLYICGFVLEDGIIAPQTLPDASIKEDYEHNHVLRTSFNGAFGQSLTSSGINANQEISKTYTATLDAGWEVENLSVVFYVYDHNTYEILQVNKHHFE